MRRTPLRRKTPLEGRSQLKRSALQAKRPEPVSEAERAAMAAFHASIKGQRCVVCKKTESEAYRGSGMGHQAHHAIRQQVLRRMGLDLWDRRLAVCVCEEPCHRRHTSRRERILSRWLPAAVFEFVGEHSLEMELEREYPA